jgi:type VI secretion system secreted protein VgrG
MDDSDEGFFDDDAKRESVLDTPLDQQPLLARMHAIEAFNQPFRFELTILSHRRTIEPAALLGKVVAASIRSEAVEDGPLRHFHGHVVSFERKMNDRFVANDMYTYELVLRPWLWLLTMRKKCRIFQKRTSLEIVKQICDEHGFGDLLDDAGVTKKGKYPRREYCTQYNESDFAFISRLLEQEGIYYYFDHEREKHRVMLADDPSVHTLEQGNSELAQRVRGKSSRYYVRTWNEVHRIHGKSYQLDDYDYLAPMKNLKVKREGMGEFAYAEGTQFEYPGGYVAEDVGNDYVATRIEAQNATSDEVSGTWSLLGPPVGSVFTVESAPGDEYLLTTAQNEFLFHDPDGRNPMPQEQPLDTSAPLRITGSFTAIPKSVPFRPSRVTPRPVIAGVQTGRVVGETLDAAEGMIVTDEHGRVYVCLHWYDLDEGDQQRSCWIRVSQPWAGNSWGAQFIPRVGQEVVVTYLDGDPDRPLIVGSVYNGLNYAPFSLPDGSISGFKTDRAVHGGVSESQPNILEFDDGKGQIAATAETVKVTAQGSPLSSVAIKGGLAAIDVGGVMQSIGMQAPKSTSAVSGMEITATAGLALTFSTPGSFIKIEPTGITMVGPMISINAPIIKTTMVPLPGPPTPDVVQKTVETTKDTALALAQLAGGSALPLP